MDIRKLSYFLGYFILNATIVSSQNSYLSAEARIVRLSSIDWTNFNPNQVCFFKDVLKIKNILVLSVENHGDGSSYEAQCMILKGLIDSGKINKIYTESSWMIIDKINRILKEQGPSGIKSTVKYMKSVELRYWADNGFWNYLAQKIIENKVKLAGFDVGASQLIVDELLKEALELEEVKEYALLNKKEFQNAIFSYQVFDGWSEQSRFDLIGYNQQKNFINIILSGYIRNNNLYRIKQWEGILNYFYWMYKRSILLSGNKYSNVPEGYKQLSAFMSIRDSLMVDHFLGDYYNSNKNDKVVVLVSAYHSLHNTNLIEGLNMCCRDTNVTVMGETLYKQFKEQIYTVCFISSSGERGIKYYFDPDKRTKILNPIDKSLELSLKDISTPYLILDLEQSKFKDSLFFMNTTFDRYFRSQWSRNLSAVFFIKEMKPLIFKNVDVLRIE